MTSDHPLTPPLPEEKPSPPLPPSGGPPPPPPPPPASAPAVEVLDLTADSRLERQKHESLLIDLEARRRAFNVDVPTLPRDVRDGLRKLGLPVRLFGEDLAAIRDRLRIELARREVIAEGTAQVTSAQPPPPPLPKEEEEEVTKYTRAPPELIEAREFIADFSLRKSRARLESERRRRRGARKRARHGPVRRGSSVAADGDIGCMSDDDEAVTELNRLDSVCQTLYKSIRSFGLEGSQYGDARPLSAVCAGNGLVATGGWSGAVKIWDGGSGDGNGALDLLLTKHTAHEDRIMGIAMARPCSGNDEGLGGSTLIATASIDLTAKLWTVRREEDGGSGAVDIRNEGEAGSDVAKSGGEGATLNSLYAIEEMAHLRGHEARLCSVAFHPTGHYVGTTSFDHTWRLWDAEAGREALSSGRTQKDRQLLLQDGHWKETYGIGFHPDGSLCATTDFGGIVQVWDLRTGKSACHFSGHAKRVICSEFSPNGFQLATAGDDGTIKVWDLRRRKQFASIPAHSKLITQIRFAHGDGSNASGQQNGEFLASCSFDGTAKVWSTRDWKMLTTLRGHEGKVMGVDVLGGRDGGIITCGYDKTLKMWK